VDLDGDKHLDIISGIYGGVVYFSKGNGKDFDKPVLLKDKAGKVINMGQYWSAKDKRFLFNDELEDQRQREMLRQRRSQRERLLKRPREPQSGAERGFYPLAVDWDADGDFDIMMGGMAGGLVLRLNEGSSESPIFATQDTPVKIAGNDFCMDKDRREVKPVCAAFADLDGDGLKDLICSNWLGTLNFYRNSGTATQPKFEEVQTIFKTPTNNEEIKADVPCNYMKVDVGDLNGDNKPDLIIGAKDKEDAGHLWVYYQK